MKKFVLTIIVLLALGAIMLPFYISSEYHSSISIATGIVSGISSLITLIIAILLYNKFGIDKSLLDKQGDVVLSLLKEIKTTRIFLENGNGHFLQLMLDALSHDAYQDYKDKELLFSTEYVKKLEPIWELAENVLLPKSISEKFKDLKCEVISSTKADPQKHFIVFHSKKNDHYGIMNMKKMTLSEFIAKWQKIIQAIEEWLNKNSSKKVALNFHRG